MKLNSKQPQFNTKNINNSKRASSSPKAETTNLSEPSESLKLKSEKSNKEGTSQLNLEQSILANYNKVKLNPSKMSLGPIGSVTQEGPGINATSPRYRDVTPQQLVRAAFSMIKLDFELASGFISAAGLPTPTPYQNLLIMNRSCFSNEEYELLASLYGDPSDATVSGTPLPEPPTVPRSSDSPITRINYLAHTLNQPRPMALPGDASNPNAYQTFNGNLRGTSHNRQSFVFSRLNADYSSEGDDFQTGGPSNFNGCDLRYATLGRNFDNTLGSMTACDLSGATIEEGAEIAGMDFTNSILRGVDFSRTNPSSCNFTNTDARGANFSSVRLSNNFRPWEIYGTPEFDNYINDRSCPTFYGMIIDEHTVPPAGWTLQNLVSMGALMVDAEGQLLRPSEGNTWTLDLRGYPDRANNLTNVAHSGYRDGDRAPIRVVNALGYRFVDTPLPPQDRLHIPRPFNIWEEVSPRFNSSGEPNITYLGQSV